MPARTRTGRTGIVIAANFPAGELLATSLAKHRLVPFTMLPSHERPRLPMLKSQSATTKKL